MNIPINDHYRIAGDQRSWSIQQPRKRRDKKTGELKTVWESCHWFTSLETLVNYLGEMLVRTADTQTLAEALAETNRVTTKLSRALSPEFRVIRDQQPDSPHGNFKGVA